MILSAILFYTVLLIVLVALPATLILVVLLFLDRERQFWQRAASVQELVVRMLGNKPFTMATGLARRFPRIAVFLARRLDPHDPWGLIATLTGVGSIIGLWFFLGVLEDIVSKDLLVVLDIRLHNLVPLFRTPGLTRLMLSVTELGGPTVLPLLSTGIALLALARNERRIAATVVLALAGPGIVAMLLKAAFGWARPIDAIVRTNEASFPSGHLLSGTVLYGLLAALLLSSRATARVRASGVTLLLLVIVGIGLSRLYLGVHWPSDLLGSLALALMLLPPLLFFLHCRSLTPWLDAVALPFSAGAVRVAGQVVLVVALGSWVVLSVRKDVLPPTVPPAKQALDLHALQTRLPPDIPRQSEDLIGSQVAPLSLVIVGSEEDLLNAFTHSGWSRADVATPVRLVHEGLAALRNQPDPTAPVAPIFLADQPQYLSLEKPGMGTPSIRQRHHVRLWQTRYCLAPDCRTVWVATASYDAGVEISARLHLPTHRIAPAIDEERDHIASDLVAMGAKLQGKVTASPALHGSNIAGDPFYTDGRAIILVLPAALALPGKHGQSDEG